MGTRRGTRGTARRNFKNRSRLRFLFSKQVSSSSPRPANSPGDAYHFFSAWLDYRVSGRKGIWLPHRFNQGQFYNRSRRHGRSPCWVFKRSWCRPSPLPRWAPPFQGCDKGSLKNQPVQKRARKNPKGEINNSVKQKYRPQIAVSAFLWHVCRSPAG